VRKGLCGLIASDTGTDDRSDDQDPPYLVHLAQGSLQRRSGASLIN
jgi:hypothetical protein